MRRVTFLFAACAAILIGTVGQAAIIGVAGGTGAPGATLGPFTMTPFLDDTRPVFDDVTTISSPLGGDITTSIPVNHREIGSGWTTWSHGYSGDVYYTNGATSVTLTLPALTGAFYFYAEPNPFSVHTIMAMTASGASVSQDVDGSSGAAYYGFFTDGVDAITSITISSLTTDFAFGEFGIAQNSSVPEPSSLALFGVGACFLGLRAARRRRREKNQATTA